MTYIVQFKDNPDANPQIRSLFMADHLAFLDAHAGEIESAGPLFDASGQGQGGLWVVHCDSRARAEALVRADPFWETGLRAKVDVLAWRQVFAGGKRTGVALGGSANAP